MKGRPEFRQMITDAENMEFGMIICKSISRFARNMKETLEITRRLCAAGVNFLFIREALDTRTMQGELILSIMAAISESESDSISENLKTARNKALMEGKVWRRPPYGYEWDKDKRWVIKKQEAERVRKIYAMAAGRECYAAIRNELNKMEETEGTGRIWSHAMVRNILTSEIYVGDYITNKHCVVTEKNGMRRRVRNDGIREQVYIEEHHPAIIGRSLFNEANDLVKLGLLHSKKAGT